MNFESAETRVLGIIFWLFTLVRAYAIEAVDCAVLIDLQTTKNPPGIILTWQNNSKTSTHIIYRRDNDVSFWTQLAKGTSEENNFVDSNIEVGKTYEYQIETIDSDTRGYGYIYAGIEIPLIDYRGIILLLIDISFSTTLNAEIGRLVKDLEGDGWIVNRLNIDRAENVQNVKDKIVTEYNKNPVDTKAVFLLGHIPVPYSGNIVPDGHNPDHLGAWPADGYYGNFSHKWSDLKNFSLKASDSRNHNIAGDRKFDQSTLPEDSSLYVGRVDFASMEMFAKSEESLLRQYLDRNHAYRHGKIEDIIDCGLVADGFGNIGGEAFAANGYRNFASLFGANEIEVVTGDSFLRNAGESKYLFGFACGSGSYTSMAGVMTSENMAHGSSSPIFNMVFGSYFGDFDTKNNLMRAILASENGGLTCSWSGRPNWFYHHMGLGETVGKSSLISQNNQDTYRPPNYGAYQVHLALLGDPTLRLHRVKPASNLSSFRTMNIVGLGWKLSEDKSVIGYNVYRKEVSSGTSKKISETPVEGNLFLDRTPSHGVLEYEVRAVKLEVGNYGSYFNQSQGIFTTVDAVINTRLKRRRS